MLSLLYLQEMDTLAKKLELRALGDEEAQQVRALAASRTAAARLVQRARVIVFMLDDPTLPADAAGRRAGYRSREAGRTWVKRFNDGGLEALEDRPRSGCPRTHSIEVRSALVDLATQKPRSLGLDFNLWTLEKLQREFKRREAVHLSDSTIWTWLRDEGLHWKRQQTWFHDAETHDPEFVEKRGPSCEPTPPRPRVAG